jgi:hypothetical protein
MDSLPTQLLSTRTSRGHGTITAAKHQFKFDISIKL